MLSTSKIKLIQSLKLKKFRQKYNLFTGEGSKLLFSLSLQNRYDVKEVYGLEESLENPVFSRYESISHVVTPAELKKISFFKNPADMVCLIGLPEEPVMPRFRRAIFLDGLQDPGNMGTIIRTADWFGIDLIVRSSDSCDPYNPKVVQATMGSFANVNFCTATLDDVLEHQGDTQILIGDEEGVSPHQISVTEPVCLVIGSEGSGVSSAIRQKAHGVITIAGVPGRLAESLNASLATGILCYALFGRGAGT